MEKKIDRFKVFPDEDTLVEAYLGEEKRRISYRRVALYMPGIRGNTEGGYGTLDGKYIIGCVTASADQCGWIYVWNPFTNRIVHWTDGSFAIGAALANNKVYSLHYVHYYGVNPYFQVRINPFKTRCYSSDEEIVKNDVFKDKKGISYYNFRELEVRSDKVYARFGRKRVLLDSDEK